jgi:hypothetical protein
LREPRRIEILSQNTIAHFPPDLAYKGEEEQNRILKLCYNKVVPHLIAMFEAQFVKEELESSGIQEGEALSRMIERLVQAVYGIEFIADLEEMHADPQIAALLQYQISLQRQVCKEKLTSEHLFGPDQSRRDETRARRR